MADASTPRPKTRPEPAGDVALVCGRSRDGRSVHVIRRRKDKLEAGVIQPLEEGKPLTGEVVTLKPRADWPALCDVEVHHDARPAQAGEGATHGKSDMTSAPTKPAKVASEAYRTNWDSIWKSGKKSPQLPN
jgi:hypothetical protein